MTFRQDLAGTFLTTGCGQLWPDGQRKGLMAEQLFVVRTAYGPKTLSSDGGAVLPHEHVMVDARVWWEGPGDWFALDPPGEAQRDHERIAHEPQAVIRENMVLSDWYLAAQELRLARDSNCQLVTDLTVQGLDPQHQLAVRAADLAGLDVVLGIGRYLESTLDETERAKPVGQVADEWLSTVHTGFDGLLPGIIGEIGTSETITSTEEISLRAAAQVQKSCGLPINVHVHPYTRQALAAIAVLEAEGADLSRVAISHCDGDLDLAWLRQLLTTGVHVEMDMFGTGPERLVAGRGYPSDDQRVTALVELCEQGFSAQLLLSHDICHRNSLHRHGGWGYDHISRVIVPKLSEHLDDDAVRQLTSENALRLLDWKGPY